MAKANVDPAELRRFAQDLKRFNGELEGLMVALNARLTSLESTWRDQEHKKFAEAFTETAKALRLFLSASSEHAAFLVKKAALVEEYLRRG